MTGFGEGTASAVPVSSKKPRGLGAEMTAHLSNWVLVREFVTAYYPRVAEV